MRAVAERLAFGATALAPPIRSGLQFDDGGDAVRDDSFTHGDLLGCLDVSGLGHLSAWCRERAYRRAEDLLAELSVLPSEVDRETLALVFRKESVA